MQRQEVSRGQEPLRVDPLLTDFDLERLTGRARSSWQKARLTGEGPNFLRLGRLVRYRASDVAAWLAARPALRSTSDTINPTPISKERNRTNG
jgi:predicted DNA-binding transcriptional regulator AlpA